MSLLLKLNIKNLNIRTERLCNKWSSTNHDTYLCLSCICKLRAANTFRKMIMKSYNVRDSIIKVKDEENYTDSELILIENRYECNQEIKNIPKAIGKEGTVYSNSECMKESGAVFNKNVYKFNQELNDVAQSCIEPQENVEIEIKEEEYLEDEYMDLEYDKDEYIQDIYVDNNDSQRKPDNGTANNEDIMLNVEDPNTTNTLFPYEIIPQNTCNPEILPNSEEDIVILKVEEHEPINELINEDIIILQVEGHASTSTQFEMLENYIKEPNTKDKSTNNMETNDVGYEVKRKKYNMLKKKTKDKVPKPNKQVTYTVDQLKEAVVAIKEGRLTVTQAVLRLKMNFRTFHKKTTQLFGVAFPRKEKQWDYRGYFREIVTVLNATNCIPFKSRFNNIYCAYCRSKYKNQGEVCYTPEQLREHVKAQHPAPTYEDVKGFMYPYHLHEVVKFDILDLECRVCPLKLDSWPSMLAHLRDVHDKQIKDGVKLMIPYVLRDILCVCALCDETLTNHTKLEKHMNVHYPNYICNKCGQQYAAKWGLNRHKQDTHHHKLYCDKCGKHFNRKSSLRKHIHNRHDMTVNVHKCKETFDRARELYEHLEMYRDGRQQEPSGPVVCTICNTEYGYISRLRDHMRRVHIDDVYYECEVCKYRFGTKDYLSKHQKRMHYDVWISKRIVSVNSRQTKTYRIRREVDNIPKVRSDVEGDPEVRRAGRTNKF